MPLALRTKDVQLTRTNQNRRFKEEQVPTATWGWECISYNVARTNLTLHRQKKAVNNRNEVNEPLISTI